MTEPVWRTSSFCSNSACVEVDVRADRVAVRDGKGSRDTGAVLYFTPDEWAAFLQGVKAGEFEA